MNWRLVAILTSGVFIGGASGHLFYQGIMAGDYGQVALSATIIAGHLLYAAAPLLPDGDAIPPELAKAFDPEDYF